MDDRAGVSVSHADIFRNYAPIGIIGGMGPEATADLYMKVIRYFQREKGAVLDHDFPEILIHSVPVPDVLLSQSHEVELLERLTASAHMLERCGVQVIAIACNSVQYLLEEIQKNIRIPILSIAEICAKHCHVKGHAKVALLSTEVTVAHDIYGQALRPRGIELVYPDTESQKEVAEIIMRQLSGTNSHADFEKLERIARNLAEKGVDAVLLGCTELPLVIAGHPSDIPFVDCTELYARATSEASIGIAQIAA